MGAPPRRRGPGKDDDATVVLRAPSARPPRRRWPWLAGGVLVAGAAVAAVALHPWTPTAPPVVHAPPPVVAAAPATAPVRPAPAPAPTRPAPVARPAPAPAPAAAPSPKPPAPAAAAPTPSAPTPAAQAPAAPTPAAQAPPAPPAEKPFALHSADEAGLLADSPAVLTVFRFAPDPQVVVLDFPSLQQQGEMLDRVAALTEKAGEPRDRVLTDAELAEAIRKGGDTVASYYYGHDYPAAALVRFFALADREHVTLDPPEERLRALTKELGWTDAHAKGALISFSRQGADKDITADVRAVILHHELSHGAFFTEPAYADYTWHFWRDTLTEAERGAIRHFLGSEDYDTANEELMANEAQAYLMFTDDPRFFLPLNIGMTEARRAELRAAFRAHLPLPWLRAALRPLPLPAAAAAISSSAPRPPATASH